MALELYLKDAELKHKREIRIGGVAGTEIFEQIDTGEYVVYALMPDNTNTWRLFTRETYDQYMPLQKTPLTHPPPPTEYESDQALYNNVKAFIHEHLDLPRTEGYDILTAFVFKTWVEELFDFTPYLGFYGRQETGKTRALEVLKELSFRAWHTTGITTATLFRLTDKLHPTLLLDESEFLTSEEQKNLVGMLNAGQRRGVLIPRMKEDLEEFEFFDVYGSKAISGTKKLKSTIQSRMVTFTMTKNVRHIPRAVNTSESAKLRSQLLMWRFHKISEHIHNPKATVESVELKQLSGRNFELFYPLYYVAATGEAKNNILQFALELQHVKLETEKTELSSTIFEAIMQLKDSKTRRGLLLIKDIADHVNANQEMQYWIAEKRVGTKCAQMGFEKVKTNRGVAIVINQALIERLRKDPRYTATLLKFSDESDESDAEKEGGLFREGAK